MNEWMGLPIGIGLNKLIDLRTDWHGDALETIRPPPPHCTLHQFDETPGCELPTPNHWKAYLSAAPPQSSLQWPRVVTTPNEQHNEPTVAHRKTLQLLYAVPRRIMRMCLTTDGCSSSCQPTQVHLY